MKNYICINGNKTELTEEQLKQLGIKLPKVSPFARIKPWGTFYYINTIGLVAETFDDGSCDGEGCDSERFAIANYCTDKAILEQRALHETLHRLLWRYALENGGEGNYEIAHNGNNFIVQNAIYKYFGQTFVSHNVAENAIKEIIEPFMKAHHDFKF